MFKKILRTSACALVALQLTACAGGGAAMVKADKPTTARSDQGLMVFMRSSFVGSAVASSIYDVSGKDTKFIGILDNANKIGYPVAPGDHTFMVIGESADFMQAKVSAGKTCYTLITPRVGVWKARFSFRPVRQADYGTAEFSNWDANTSFVVNTPQSESWAAGAAADVAEKRTKYWPEWQAKPADQRASQTLNPEDCR